MQALGVVVGARELLSALNGLRDYVARPRVHPYRGRRAQPLDDPSLPPSTVYIYKLCHHTRDEYEDDDEQQRTTAAAGRPTPLYARTFMRH